MKKIFTTNVTLDIHPDGDIYIFDGKQFCYAGHLTDEENPDPGWLVATSTPTQRKALRLFRKFKIKSPLK